MKECVSVCAAANSKLRRHTSNSESGNRANLCIRQEWIGHEGLSR